LQDQFEAEPLLPGPGLGPGGEVRWSGDAKLSGRQVSLEGRWTKRLEREYGDRRCLPMAKLREDAAVLASPAGRKVQPGATEPPPRTWDDIDDDLER